MAEVDLVNKLLYPQYKQFTRPQSEQIKEEVKYIEKDIEYIDKMIEIKQRQVHSNQ